MEKKKMTNKKKFWIGMASLAAVGIITATVAYFSSLHIFDTDNLATLNYTVSAQKLLDAGISEKLTPNKTENMDVIVTNEGKVPVLARVYYRDINQNNVKLEDTELLKKWKFDFVSDNKFVYNEGDGAYYYKGIINGDGGSAQHLDAVTYVGTGGTPDVSTEYTTNGGTNWVDEISEGTLNGTKKTYTLGDTTDLTVIVETIQATDATGTALDSSAISNKSEAELKGCWNTLGKGDLWEAQ